MSGVRSKMINSPKIKEGIIMKFFKVLTFVLFTMFSIHAMAADSTATDSVSVYQYLSPMPGSVHVTRFTTLILRFNDVSPFEVANLDSFVTLMAQNGDTLSGGTKIASDEKTIIFEPYAPLTPGDTVTVSCHPHFTSNENDSLYLFQYQFCVSGEEYYALSQMAQASVPLERREISGPLYSPEQTESTNKAATATIQSNGISIPSNLPHINITINDNPDSGYIFMNNWDDSNPFDIIFDNNGEAVWYMQTQDRRRDFKVQKNGIMTMLVRGGYPFGPGYIGFDTTYTVVDSFYAKHGYWTDEHELQVLENGYYLLVAIREHRVDMTQYVENGQKNAIILESCLQEFTPEGDMIFQWRAWDHIDIADTGVPGECDLRGGYIRYPHMNAIDIDTDENILLSSRHASEVTKINRQTGEVIWRFGGEKNQFTIINDPLNGPQNQHDIRSLGNNRYTLFDNGNEHDPRVSRAVEYEIDEENKTATLVWEFRDNPDKYSHYMGNTQRLPNGNTLINWAEGYLPKITEVRPNGEKAFEMNWENRYDTYRVFRFRWNGIARIPSLVIEPNVENTTLLFNKFGDPDVAYYKIYGGPEPGSTTLLDTSKVTMKNLTNLESGQLYFIRVTAVNKNGEESDFSNEEILMVGVTEPGKNMVINGDFSDRRLTYWGLYCVQPDGAIVSVVDSVCNININDAGTEFWHVQFYQPFISLIQGEDYLFEFDAWAEEDRDMTVWVCKASGNNTNYGRTSRVLLDTRKKHFSYPFKMRYASDYNAVIVFFFGGSNANAYLDNVSLKRVVDSNVENNLESPLIYEIAGNYPNPFNAQTTINFSVRAKSRVKMELYNILGQLEEVLTNDIFESGVHQVNLDANRLGTGVYFCRMTATETATHQTFRDIHKLLLVK